MNYTQNEKLLQVGEENLIIGIDVGSKKHYARAFDWRGIEYSKKAFAFSNDVDGFAGFLEWISAIQKKTGKETVIPGMEPTGHYWFDLALFLRDNGMKPVLVNPLHVKRSKELDDHLPNKNDMKDPKTIAKLIIEGRYAFPYLPEGIYAEIRNASNMRFQVEAELTRNKNRIQRWFASYFPEYTEVYGSFDAITQIIEIPTNHKICRDLFANTVFIGKRDIGFMPDEPTRRRSVPAQDHRSQRLRFLPLQYPDNSGPSDNICRFLSCSARRSP